MNYVKVVSKATRKGLENEINQILSENADSKLIDIKFDWEGGSYMAVIIFEKQ